VEEKISLYIKSPKPSLPVPVLRTGKSLYTGYGLLYNWYAATDVRNIAPAGWHVPTQSEFQALITYLGGELVAGGKLKELGTDYWDPPNSGATNEVGYNGRGTGVRTSYGGSFLGIKINATFWSSTTGGVYAKGMSIVNSNAYASINDLDYENGLPLRLIKDDSVDPGKMTGIDGQIYPTVKVGIQVWMAQNLAETKYRNGDSIPEVKDNSSWANLTSGAKCWYNNIAA
jgi:uncharacterized protein (TIGR02145 family)